MTTAARQSQQEPNLRLDGFHAHFAGHNVQASHCIDSLRMHLEWFGHADYVLQELIQAVPLSRVRSLQPWPQVHRQTARRMNTYICLPQARRS